MKKPHDDRVSVTNLVTALTTRKKGMYHFVLDDDAKAHGTVTYGSKNPTKWRLSRTHKDANIELHLSMGNASKTTEVENLPQIEAALQAFWSDTAVVLSLTRRPEGHVLLMWERIPETVDLYLIPADHASAPMVRNCSNLYIGATNDGISLIEVCNLIEGGAFNHFKAAAPLKATITEVIRAGVHL